MLLKKRSFHATQGIIPEIEIPAEWAKLSGEAIAARTDVPDFIRDVVDPINALCEVFGR